MTYPITNTPSLPPNTIVPQNENLYIPYFTSLYQSVASAVNSKDVNFFPMGITDTAANIVNLPNFGSYTVCVSGATSGMPCIVVALCKASNAASGTIAVLTSQAGTVAPWLAATLTVTSTATNYQIAHSVVTTPIPTTGKFNIRIIGTQ